MIAPIRPTPGAHALTAVVAFGIAGVIIVTAAIVWGVPVANRGTPPVYPCCTPIRTPIPIPLGTALAIGSPGEASLDLQYWYNFTVQSASSGLLWENLSFEILSPSSVAVPALASWHVVVVGLTGAAVAEAAQTTYGDSWAFGGGLTVTSGSTISFFSGTSNLSGDTLEVIGYGGFTGSISVVIP
jgi:hypothetical protein